MSPYVLRSPREADDTLVDLLLSHSVGDREISLQLQIREDICFSKDAWVPAGTVTLHPEVAGTSAEMDDEHTTLRRALRCGFFDWTLPDRCPLETSILGALRARASGNRADRELKHVNEAAKAVVHAAMRCGIAYPLLDAMALSSMPFRSTATVVADTSAVLQGGLDFAALHLVPAARITIPAIVHMEILNYVDRYGSQRHQDTHKYSARMLLDHVLSQGGQRTLLRLEREHQLERSRLGADPLRGIIQPDSDAEDKNLQLQRIQRSFADRLILETAIQRRDRADPNHPIMLMTADQGLARMALAEGIEPIYFDAKGATNLLGTTMSGVTFRPLPSADRAHVVPLTRILWELAVAFGRARLIKDRNHIFEVVAIGEGLSWQPYHSADDLMWTSATPIVHSPPTAPAPDVVPPNVDGERPPRTTTPKAKYAGSYSFSPDSMLRVMTELSRSPISDENGMNVAGVNSINGYVEYYRFLLAGGFVSRTHNQLEAKESLVTLVIALSNSALDHALTLLRNVSSFDHFVKSLTVSAPITAKESGVRRTAFPSYCSFAEVCCAGVRFAEDGIYATPTDPPPDEFTAHALQAYNAVREGDDFALTGAWLEHMVRNIGIHPERARQRLAEAFQAGYLRRFFEGSTPDTRYESRTFCTLDRQDSGGLAIRRVNLYHGEFLVPGSATGSIRLLEGKR